MLDIIMLIGGIFCLSILFSVLADPDEQALADAKFCRGCECGWCMCVPNDEECRKWRKKHEQRTGN